MKAHFWTLIGALAASPAAAHQVGIPHLEPHPDPVGLAVAIAALGFAAWLALRWTR